MARGRVRAGVGRLRRSRLPALRIARIGRKSLAAPSGIRRHEPVPLRDAVHPLPLALSLPQLFASLDRDARDLRRSRRARRRGREREGMNAAPSLAARIDAALPQTQCTRCGYPTCRAYADAIARDEADIDRCPPGG